MTVARGPQVCGRTFALLLAAGALLALAGCDGVSDSTTYPAAPVVAPPAYFFGVWGTGADDVYVVGQPGLIYHWDGQAWDRQDCPTSAPLTSVWGDDQTGRVYVTGHDGVILRSTGDGIWTRMGTGTAEPLYDVGEFIQQNPGGDTRQVVAVGRGGTILRLAGDAWQSAANPIMVRNNTNAPADTLQADDVNSLSCVFDYGFGGAYFDDRPGVGGVKGCVLLNDTDLEYLLRPIAGGEGWVTAAIGDAAVSNNYVATDHGRLFRAVVVAGAMTFTELYSPALGEIVYGIWADADNTVHAVSSTGRITRVTTANEFTQLYHDGLTLFDIWGTASDNLYAVGIDGRILHYAAPEGGGDPVWTQEEIVLPADKAGAGAGCDKFGRPL